MILKKHFGHNIEIGRYIAQKGLVPTHITEYLLQCHDCNEVLVMTKICRSCKGEKQYSGEITSYKGEFICFTCLDKLVKKPMILRELDRKFPTRLKGVRSKVKKAPCKDCGKRVKYYSMHKRYCKELKK